MYIALVQLTFSFWCCNPILTNQSTPFLSCKDMRKCCRCNDEHFCQVLCREQHKGSRGYHLWEWRGIWEISWRWCPVILEGEGLPQADKRQGDKDTSCRRKCMNTKAELQRAWRIRTIVSGSERHYWNGLREEKRHRSKMRWLLSSSKLCSDSGL